MTQSQAEDVKANGGVSPPGQVCDATKDKETSGRTFTAPSGKHYVIARETYPSEPPPRVQGEILSAMEGDLIELFMMQGGMGYGRRFKERTSLVNEGVFRLEWVNGIRLVLEDGKRRPVEVDIDGPQFGFQNPKGNDAASKLRTKRWRKKIEDVSKVWDPVADALTADAEVSAANAAAAALEKADAQEKAKKLRKLREQEQRKLQRERELREQEHREQEIRDLIRKQREQEEENERRQKQYEREQREKRLRADIQKRLEEQLKEREQQQQQSQQLRELQELEVKDREQEQSDEKQQEQNGDQEDQKELGGCQDLKQEKMQETLCELSDKHSHHVETLEHMDSKTCDIALQTSQNLVWQNVCTREVGVQCMLLTDTKEEEDADGYQSINMHASKHQTARRTVDGHSRKKGSLFSASWDPHWEEQAAHLEALLSASSSGMEDSDGRRHRQPTVQRKIMTRKFAKSLLQAKRSGELHVIAEEWEKAHTEMANKASDLTALHDKVKRSLVDAHQGGSLENLAEEMANEAERKAAEVRQLKERVFRAMFDMRRSKKLEKSTADMDDAQRELEMKALQLKLMKRAWKGMLESKRQCELESIASEMATGFQTKADSLKNKMRDVLLRAHRAGELREMREELDELANVVPTMPDIVHQGCGDMAAQQRKRWAEFSSDSDSSFGFRSGILRPNYMHGQKNRAQQAVAAHSDADGSCSDADGGSNDTCSPSK